MKLRTAASAVLTILILTCFACRLSSQPTQDYRLSPDPLDYRLPEDIRIQAAGEIGDSRLVVWGTTINDGSGNVVNALVMSLNGSQTLLTSPEARPYGAVGIVPLADRLLVVWNDRRPTNPGLYGVLIATGGDRGKEFVFSKGGIMDRYPVLLRFGDQVLFLWNDTRTGTSETWGQYIEPDGSMPAAGRFVAAGSVDLASSYRTRNGTTIINMGSYPAFLLSADGEPLPRTIEAVRLNSPHWFVNDTTVGVAHDGMFSFYQSIFDSLPTWQIGNGSTNPIGAFLVGRDTGGFYTVTYSYSLLQTSPVGWSVTLYRTFIDSTGVVSQEIADFADQSLAPQGSMKDVVVEPSRQQGCSNSSSGTVSFTGMYREAFSGSGYKPFEASYGFSIDSGGMLRIRTHAGIVIDGCAPLSIATPSIERVRSDTVSVVQFEDTRYSSGAFYEDVRSEARQPWIGLHNDNLIVAWQSVPTSTLVTRPYSAFMKEIGETKRFSVGKSPNGPSVLWGGFLWRSVSGKNQEAYNPSFGIVYDYDLESSVTVPTSGGWVTENVRSESGQTQRPYARAWLTNDGEGYDPNTDHLAFATYLEEKRLFGVTFINQSGGLVSYTSEVWNRPPFGEVVPVNDSVILFITRDDVVYRISSDSVALPFATLMTSNNSAARCYRLFGSRFLRIVVPIESATMRGLELYDLRCNAIDSMTVEVPNSDFPFLLQNPADSSIVLLWGSNRGVRCAYFDKNLKEVTDASSDVILTDFRVSVTSDSVSHPAGIFRNDTLFVVWEDFRNGPEADIYGTWWAVPKGTRGIGEGTITDTITTPPQVPIPGDVLASGIRIVSITPNPVIGEAAITIESTEPRVGSVALYDALGRRVLERELLLMDGVGTYRLDVSRLSSGSYGVDVKAGTSVGQARLIVLGQ